MSASLVFQIIEHKETKFDPEIISYNGNSRGLSGTIEKISLHHYASGALSDIYMSVNAKSAHTVHAALKSAGLASEDHFLSNASNGILKIRNVDPEVTLIHAVTALATGGNRNESSANGFLSADTANQIIGYELARTGKTALDLGLMTSGSITIDNPESGVENPQPPRVYVTSEILHPLSHIVYMEEIGNFPPATRIGIRDANNTAVVSALNNAGVSATAGVDKRNNDHFVMAAAPADKTAGVLETAGILPSFIAQPIIEQAGLRPLTLSDAEGMKFRNRAQREIMPSEKGNSKAR